MLYLMVFNRTPYQHIKNDMSKQMAIRRGDTINFDGIEDPSLLDCLQVKANLVFFFCEILTIMIRNYAYFR